MRTAILGNAGSGKSTLAKALAAESRVPLLDLDTIVWAPDAVAVPRASESVREDLARFCDENAGWVIEGCYGNLVQALLAHRPELIFLHPGKEQCLANCRERPWEPHKYDSKAEQDRQLEVLLTWVADYYERDDDMSLRCHQALFDAYEGPKRLLTALPEIALSATVRPA